MSAGLQEVKFRIYNSTLDPKIWDENMVLNPEVKVKLLKVAQDFYRNTELKAPIVDILFLGSTTNYNWTSTSDIDLHVVVDITKESIDPKLARQFMDGLGAGWNNNHEISIKGHPVEVYLQDQTEKNSTPAQSRKGSTIYSLLKGCWLKAPDRNRVDVDKEKIKQKYHKIKTMVDEFVVDKDVNKLKKLMKALKNYRNAGLERVGEFSTENLVFKALRHTNVITKLKDAINTLYDKSTSLDEALKNGNYLVIGLTNADLQVIGQKKTDQRSDLDHGMLRGADRMMQTHAPVHWRYRSKDNTIYWWLIDVLELESHGEFEKIRDATLDFLRMRFGVSAPLESKSKDDYFKKGHHINEMVSTDKLIIGNITDDLEINSIQVSDSDKSGNHRGSGADVLHSYQNKFSKADLKYLKENIGIDNLYVGLITPELDIKVKKATPKKTGHMTLFPDYHSIKYRSWRYRKDLNELFWWDDPTPEEKEEVLAWLKTYLGVIQRPKQTIMYSVDSINQGKGKSVYNTPTWYASHPEKSIDELLEKDAELFLGFIRRDNLKVVGTHVEDEDFTHFHFQFELGGDWRNLGDSELIPWRFKKSDNTIYWWYPKPHPNEDEKKTVEWWLEKNVNVKHPHHKMMSNYAPDALDRVGNMKNAHNMNTNMNEGKFDPFTAKALDFVTYGGLSLTKQRGFGKEDPTFHAPPARKGIYAFVWPYIEKFLLGGAEFIDPKQRGKGQRQRMKYVKDKEGNVISSDHPDWEKSNQGEKGKNWSFSRERPDSTETDDYDKQYTHFLYNNAARKKFKYNGPLWHHLHEFVRQDKILDEKGEWVKTDMATFKEALKKELHRVMKADMEFGKGKQFRGLSSSSHSWDQLEVFIDQKI